MSCDTLGGQIKMPLGVMNDYIVVDGCVVPKNWHVLPLLIFDFVVRIEPVKDLLMISV